MARVASPLDFFFVLLFSFGSDQSIFFLFVNELKYQTHMSTEFGIFAVFDIVVVYEVAHVVSMYIFILTNDLL